MRGVSQPHLTLKARKSKSLTAQGRTEEQQVPFGKLRAGSRHAFAAFRGYKRLGMTTPFEGLDGGGVADFLDGAGDDGGGVFGVMKFEVHAAAYILELEHGASPSGTGDGDVDGVGTEFGMAGEESIAASEKHGGVAVVHGLDVENGGWRKIVKKDAAFDFGLDDGVVDFIREIGVGGEHGRA